MQIIKELDQSERNALTEKHKNDENFDSHIKYVIDRIHCYWVNVLSGDYGEILILSSAPNIGNNYISDTVAHINTHWEEFFAGRQLGLRNDKVQHYLDQLARCSSRLQACFAELGDCFVLDRNGLEVTDGMHRLVAYGLASGMNQDNFPIPIYLGTDRNFDVTWYHPISST